MTVVNRYEDPVNRTQKLDFDKGMGLTFLSGKDRRKLLDAIAAATPEEPDAAFSVLIAVDQEYRLHRLEPRRCAPLRKRGGPDHR